MQPGLMAPIQQHVAELGQTSFEGHTFEHARFSQRTIGVVIGQGNQGTEVGVAEIRHLRAVLKRSRQVTNQVLRLLMRHLCCGRQRQITADRH